MPRRWLSQVYLTFLDSLSLSLSQTHTHSEVYILSFLFSSLALSLSNKQKHTHSRKSILSSLILSLFLTLSDTYTFRSLYLIFLDSLSHSLYLSLTLSLTHTHTLGSLSYLSWFTFGCGCATAAAFIQQKLIRKIKRRRLASLPELLVYETPTDMHALCQAGVRGLKLLVYAALSY